MSEQNPEAKGCDRADASYYDYYATGIEGDVSFYVEEAQKAGSPILELGCGTGRITIPVAKAGLNIVGLDLAPAMLAIARQKVAGLNSEAQGRITLVPGDMRHFSLPQRFQLVMIPYRAFQHLLTSQDQREALRCIHRHLTAQGHLVFNIFDPRLDIISAHSGPLGEALKMDCTFVYPDTGRRVIVWDTRQYDPGRQMLEQYFIFEELDEEGQVIRKTYSPLVLRYIYRYEMQYLLELCGFEIEALYGDFHRRTFGYGGEQIWVVRKR